MILRADCTGECVPLWSPYCLDLCLMTWTWVWHGELRGCGVGCVATMAIECECVLDLFRGLDQNLGSCARHCHRSACAAWMAGPKAFPPAQDPT